METEDIAPPVVTVDRLLRPSRSDRVAAITMFVVTAVLTGLAVLA